MTKPSFLSFISLLLLKSFLKNTILFLVYIVNIIVLPEFLMVKKRLSSTKAVTAGGSIYNVLIEVIQSVRFNYNKYNIKLLGLYTSNR